MIVTGVPLALTGLAADTNPNLVMPIGLGAARDKPTTAALVGLEDIVAVNLEETQSAKYVSWFGGGWWRWLRYALCVHMTSKSVWAGPRGAGDSCGAFSFNTRIVPQNTPHV